MDTADDVEIQQTVLYHLNMDHASVKIREMDCLQFTSGSKKLWNQDRIAAIITMTDMWGPSRDGGVKSGFFEDKEAWRHWLQAVHEVVVDWEGFDDWKSDELDGFKDVRNMGINELNLKEFSRLAVHILTFFINSFVTRLGYYPSPMLCPPILANQRCEKHKKKFGTGLT